MQIVANAVEGGASCAAYAPEIRSEGGSETFTRIHSAAVNVANRHIMRNVVVIRNEREIAPNFCQLRGTSSSTQASLIQSSFLKLFSLLRYEKTWRLEIWTFFFFIFQKNEPQRSRRRMRKSRSVRRAAVERERRRLPDDQAHDRYWWRRRRDVWRAGGAARRQCPPVDKFVSRLLQRD